MTSSLTRRHLLALTSAALSVSVGGTARAQTPVVTNLGIGDPAAKVLMAEYLSFTCPHCARFHAEVYGRLKADYIDTGKVRLEYHEVYFDQLGLLAAMLARCAGEMRYFNITDMLFEKQMDWAGAGNLQSAVDELKKIGMDAGMDGAAMDACLSDQAMAEALVAQYQKDLETNYPGDSFGGTPSFIINGVQYSNMGYDELKPILDAELAK